MNKIEIQVPRGIRYMSDWVDFKLEDYPYIIDKQIPGCGFTHWCLTNQDDIILCSPRKVLLENKKDQLGEDVFLVRSFYMELGVDKDITPSKKSTRKGEVDAYKNGIVRAKEAAKKNFELIKGELITYWYMCRAQKKPVKILVTYDSYYKVKEVFKELKVFDQFRTVVDEWQSVFIDARFKSDTELEFLHTLQDVQKVCYVSATPMMEEYLDQLDEFKNLPYVVIDWTTLDPSRTLKPNLNIMFLRSFKGIGRKIIESYKNGDFESSAVSVDGVSKIVQSKEAVIYVNSINNIINLIKWNDLTPAEVNILCADTEDNQKRIKEKLGKEFSIGKVPTKDEPRKMFTFCTRTVYLGADFYSDNARSFILSDANIEAMAVDITLDLPQIMGRQRLDENPWKNKADLYVKVLAGKNKKDSDEFKSMIQRKLKETKELLDIYNNTEQSEGKHTLANRYEKMAILLKYQDDYVAVNTRAGNDLVPCQNNLAYIAEQRAFDIQQVDYADRFIVFNRVNKVFSISDKSIEEEVKDFMSKYDSLTESSDKLRLLCTADLSDAGRCHVLDQVKEYHKKFYIFLGPERCRALGYNYVRLENECSIQNFDNLELKDAVYSKFTENTRVPLSEIKLTLKDIYGKIGYAKTPKATDLNEWFETKKVKILKDPLTKKYVDGLELLKKKG